MQTYETFVFERYTFDPAAGRIELHYSLDNAVHFTETITLPRSSRTDGHTRMSEHLDAALFTLHLIGGISYYKTCCPKRVVIRSGSLTPEQAAFWDEVYTAGLGQFFYENNLDSRGLVRFPATSSAAGVKQTPPREKSEITSANSRILVPVGGGKDSIVTIELLKAAGYSPILFRMNGHPVIVDIARIADCPLLTAERRLSPVLFALNASGALNGHIPITAFVSVLSVVVALREGITAIAMSDERSASEGSLFHHGREINHQWSKSLQFERMFQQYLRSSVSSHIRYFSLLRPFGELAIAKIFTAHPQYLRIATSCNANWKCLVSRMRGGWCGQCPKCAFVFTLLLAFLPRRAVVEIFGADLFSKIDLLSLFRRLLGREGCKPFECVGTPEEMIAACLLVHERGECDDTLLMQFFLCEILPTIPDAQAVIAAALRPSPDHAIPPAFSKILTSHP